MSLLLLPICEGNQGKSTFFFFKKVENFFLLSTFHYNIEAILLGDVNGSWGNGLTQISKKSDYEYLALKNMPDGATSPLPLICSKN